MIKIIGIPYDLNSSFLRGAAYAPSRIRLMDKDGSANSFTELGKEITEGRSYWDAGDIVFEDLRPEAAFHKIKATIAGLLVGADSKVISLGGDHSITYPIIEAYTEKYADLHILHIDAHGDLYENFGNNPFSHASPFARIMEKGKVASLTQVGIRAMTTHLWQQAKKYGVRVIEPRNFNLDFIKDLRPPLYISLDLDGLDPAFAPGVSHHEPGGLTTRELLHILQRIDIPIVGADIVEYNPMRDINNMTAIVAYKLLKELVGKME